MTSKYFIVLSIYGRRAVNVAKQFQKGFCYRGIYEHGKRIGQLEIVIDAEGTHNGFENAWTDVLCKPCDVNKVLNQLNRLGFAGCYALISDIDENTNKQNDYNLFIQI